MTHYNPWPLGQLRESWQRQEPELIRKLGYEWDDPRDINDLFAKKLASYCGSKYAVLTDSCSNALFLSLKLKGAKGQISIPKNTYVSVPAQIIHAGGIPVFKDLQWSGSYELGQTGIFDSAARFTQGMYAKSGGGLQCLSFQIKKRLPIGRGGAILTNSETEYEWLQRAVYDGRDLSTPYDSDSHVNMLGWHFYMTPEDAARGLLLLHDIELINEDTMTDKNYPDLTNWEPFKSIHRENGQGNRA
jgi:dTDP-4-amino-4,6-dideoxygalactose transaminase